MSKLPVLNRRAILLGLAAASAGAATAVVADTAAAVDSDVPPENSVLLSLSAELDAADAERITAAAAYWQIVRQWEPQWPVAPDAIVAPSHWPRHFEERGLRGWTILADGSIYQMPKGAALFQPHEKPRNVHPAADFAQIIDRIDRDMRRRRLKHPLTPQQLMALEAERSIAADKLTIANDYETRRAEVLRRSGYADADKRKKETEQAVFAVVGKVMSEQPVTMAGILIQAEALEILGRTPLYEFHIDGWKWPQQFAANLLRIAREAPARQA